MQPVHLKVDVDRTGRPRGATAEARVARSAAHLWKVIEDVDRYPERVPMIHRVRLDGDRATVDLKFKVSLISVGFRFVVDVKSEPEKWLELSWVDGEPRDIRLRFDLDPIEGEDACMLRSSGAFDVMSLGWLAKYFLKHHPEIQFGVLPGVALALLESMRRAAEEGL
ncbi:MAG: SRPBCC family protein [Polyangiaceae bacterium]